MVGFCMLKPVLVPSKLFFITLGDPCSKNLHLAESNQSREHDTAMTSPQNQISPLRYRLDLLTSPSKCTQVLSKSNLAQGRNNSLLLSMCLSALSLHPGINHSSCSITPGSLPRQEGGAGKEESHEERMDLMKQPN